MTDLVRYRARNAWLIAAGLLLALPATAHAHASMRGIGPFGSGFIHPLLTPSHVLMLLGLGLWIGQQSPLRLKLPLLFIAPAAAAGLLLTAKFPMPVSWQPALNGLALGAGLLVASAARLPAPAAAAVFALGAFAIAFDSGVDTATTGADLAKTLAGTWISIGLWSVNIAFYTSKLPAKKWIEIGIRIAGSWIAAISVLVLAFALRGK